MTYRLPSSPSDGQVINTGTGETFEFDSDNQTWIPSYLVETQGDSMYGVIAYPDLLLNKNTLTADYNDGTVQTEGPDMTAWSSSSKITSLSYIAHNGVAYGNGKWIATGMDTRYSNWKGESVIAISSDGAINWSTKDLPNVNPKGSFDIAYGNGVFVTVTSNGDKCIYSDDDGETWQETSGLTGLQRFGITYGAGKFVATSANGSPQVAVSEDGVTFRAPSGDFSALGFNRPWKGIVRGDDKFVMVSGISYGNSYAAYSPDGETWAMGSGMPAASWTEVAYGNGRYVAVALNDVNNPSGPVIMSSEDGINWQEVTYENSTGHNWKSITYGAGYFVAVGDHSDSRKIAYSKDGINWEFANTPQSNSMNCVRFAGDRFVAVSSSGTLKAMYLEVPDSSKPKLYFNGDTVRIGYSDTFSATRLVSGLRVRLGVINNYNEFTPSDSDGITEGSLWLNPKTSKIHIYHNDTWKELN